MKSDQIIYTKGEPSVTPNHTLENEAEEAFKLENTFHGMTLPDEEDVNVGAAGCQRCEVTPTPIRGPGTVRLNMAHTHTLGKVLAFLAKSSWEHSETDGTVSVRVVSGSLAPLLSPILGLMSPLEQRGSKAFFQPEDRSLKIKDFFKIESLPTFAARARSEWLLDILREKRVFSVFQPIVHCRDGDCAKGNEIFGYECLMRAGIDGEIVAPGAMLAMARAAGLIFQLDLAARRAAITAAHEHRINQKVFINFTPNSVYNPYSCLQSTVRMIDEAGLKREQVVFEIVESERLPEMSFLKRIVSFYRENGFGIALDDVGSGFSSLNVLVALRPDYIKLDMELIRNVHEDAAKALVVRKLLETAQELELKTIAEGIETAEELAWVKKHGADFVQGYYFARPAAPPPSISVF